MRFSIVAVVACLAGVTNAHFRLNYPEPRGAFVADDEPKFCGGHDNAVNNRTTFPLSDGFFTIKAGHPGWTAGVIISTVQNPTSFDNFTVNGEQQLVKGYAKEDAAGTFCIPLNISAANIPGVKEGSNVTIQVVFEGGDGNLYQCADLTLSNNATISSNSTCKNETSDHGHGSDAPKPSQTAGSVQNLAGYTGLFMGFGSMALLLL
ncbi:hypothetical protein BDZ94DRAFT_1315425 [Collybia nuda]|uniref:Copper acquisition factor BIM1-like domain-containing protein n=1 Tax=Collybia nuda TaxID=64659 RepID=A0A9P5XR55_9AGAR|nr:hypothetical protein BDZ94DRAFT_1315425 [Collybia nuda]